MIDWEPFGDLLGDRLGDLLCDLWCDLLVDLFGDLLGSLSGMVPRVSSGRVLVPKASQNGVQMGCPNEGANLYRCDCDVHEL